VVRFDLMAAIEAPNDEPQMGRRRVAERHRVVGFGFHRRGVITLCSPGRLDIEGILTACMSEAKRAGHGRN
jgi:hypothetical protein